MSSFKDIASELTTVADFIRWGASRFNEAALHFGHGTDNALDESAWLVLHALHLPNQVPPHFLDACLTDAEKHAVYKLLQRRIKERIPAAYLTGEMFFAGLRFAVDEHVLIPRSAIAELIEQHFEPWIYPGRVERILDLCTGSGCIAVACAHYFPDARVDAADISVDALQIARDNAHRYGLDGQVHCFESDLFDALPNDARYDIIVSNPPYVGEDELTDLPAEYAHEPRLALAGGGEDGLELVARLLRDAVGFLKPDGILILEVGNSWKALEERYPEVDFTWLEFERGHGDVLLLTGEQLQAHRDVW